MHTLMNDRIITGANVTHEEYVMIESYISYYNTRRVQRNLGVLTPLEKFNLYLAA